jgi:hypothetical protein
LDRPVLHNENLAWVKRFVLALYPDLEVRQAMTISAQQPVHGGWQSGGRFHVVVGNENWETSLHPQGPGAMTSLTLSVRMDRQGRVHEAWDGLSSFTQARDRFGQQVEQHGEWTEAEAVQALLAAGATFGPDARERLLARVPLKQLEPFIGTCKIGDLDFTLRTDNGGAPALPKFRANVAWTLTLRDCVRPDEQPLTYVLTFEPFGGTLIRLGVR